MTPLEHYLAFLGWERNDDLPQLWEAGEMSVDLEDPACLEELARCLRKPVAVVASEVAAFGGRWMA